MLGVGPAPKMHFQNAHHNSYIVHKCTLMHTMKHRLSITVSEGLIRELDQRRGLASKSAFVEYELKERFASTDQAKDRTRKG